VTDRPFTVAVCQVGPCSVGGRCPDLLPRLAAVIRRSRHGVLIRTGCLLGAPRCQASAAHDSGCYLMVQPCDADRRPRGAAIPVGPILTGDDADGVLRWLADGDLDAGRLDARVRVGPDAA
jgi:hypothetical protein